MLLDKEGAVGVHSRESKCRGGYLLYHQHQARSHRSAASRCSLGVSRKILPRIFESSRESALPEKSLVWISKIIAYKFSESALSLGARGIAS